MLGRKAKEIGGGEGKPREELPPVSLPSSVSPLPLLPSFSLMAHTAHGRADPADVPDGSEELVLGLLRLRALVLVALEEGHADLLAVLLLQLARLDEAV